MDTQKLLECLDRIERNADAIYVRHHNRNCRLSELPTKLAIEWVCMFVRRNLPADGPPVWDIANTALGREFEEHLKKKP